MARIRPHSAGDSLYALFEPTHALPPPIVEGALTATECSKPSSA